MSKIVITSPLRFIYLHGPSLAGFGFWNGVPYSQICAQITKVDNEHWKDHSFACQSLIDRQVDAFVVSVLLGMMITFIAQWVLKTTVTGVISTFSRQKGKLEVFSPE